jgi:hypothetical protein
VRELDGLLGRSGGGKKKCGEKPNRTHGLDYPRRRACGVKRVRSGLAEVTTRQPFVLGERESSIEDC